MKKHYIFTLLAGLVLSACSTSTQDRATRSGFATPTESGAINNRVERSQKTDGVVRNASGDGFAYAAGTLNGGGFGAYAGILPQTRVAEAPTSGSAVYDGRYTMALISGIDLNGSRLTGLSRAVSGDITLRANFDNATVRGTSDNGFLSVDSRVTGRNTLDGTVDYRGVSGDLQGRISQREAVAVFHGNSAETIFAGGILAEAR